MIKSFNFSLGKLEILFIALLSRSACCSVDLNFFFLSWKFDQYVLILTVHTQNSKYHFTLYKLTNECPSLPCGCGHIPILQWDRQSPAFAYLTTNSDNSPPKGKDQRCQAHNCTNSHKHRVTHPPGSKHHVFYRTVLEGDELLMVELLLKLLKTFQHPQPSIG